ncbi:MarR family winged helix-turn-helix transcriptional regulator [Pseudooceanicola sp. C21-150M6]|uniref:MarR family winged helix-turn-helix transcriptional regulator n=1 Tax=Pseudooceanicola sp. C21-150M6 TaxID=3434355 RepID=UPI003D7F694C
MNDSPDALRALGLLVLGSRLRRLGERLQADTQVLLDGLEPRVAAGCHPLLNLLDEAGAQSVGQISAALGVSQPGVTRNLASLSKLGVIAITPAPEDARVRQVALTARGSALVAEARAGAWQRVAAAMEELCQGFGPELLDQLAQMEDRLADRPLSQRGETR